MWLATLLVKPHESDFQMEAQACSTKQGVVNRHVWIQKYLYAAISAEACVKSPSRAVVRSASSPIDKFCAGLTLPCADP